MNLLTFILPESSTFNMSYFKGSLRESVKKYASVMLDEKRRLMEGK
jgi:hypothetical protein